MKNCLLSPFAYFLIVLFSKKKQLFWAPVTYRIYIVDSLPLKVLAKEFYNDSNGSRFKQDPKGETELQKIRQQAACPVDPFWISSARSTLKINSIRQFQSCILDYFCKYNFLLNQTTETYDS